MDSIFKYVNGFLSGLITILLAILPLSILWTVLTGGTVFGIDAINGLTNIVNGFGNGGFAGLVVLVIVASLFIKK